MGRWDRNFNVGISRRYSRSGIFIPQKDGFRSGLVWRRETALRTEKLRLGNTKHVAKRAYAHRVRVGTPVVMGSAPAAIFCAMARTDLTN